MARDRRIAASANGTATASQTERVGLSVAETRQRAGLLSGLQPFRDPKGTLRTLVQRTANNRLAWSFYRTAGRISDALARVYDNAQAERLTTRLFPELMVVDGPFKGMRYPGTTSVGSTLAPKLLGLYESELSAAVRAALSTEYGTVVDIGCAEGYYAVGFALALPTAQVYAFDTSPEARSMCCEMASLNGVSDRVRVGGFCDAQALRSLPLGNRALILSDCEGYEAELFSADLAAFLGDHDVIVEAHGSARAARLCAAFADTHDVESIRSVDDYEKVFAYRSAALAPLNVRDRYLLLREGRMEIGEWLILTSRSHVADRQLIGIETPIAAPRGLSTGGQ